VENIQVITGEELVNRSEIGTIRVLYNQHLFTKPGFKSWRTESIFLPTESRQILLERNDAVGSQNATHN
jgi:hypothetical protein